MSKQGSGHAAGNQRRPSNHRPPPQAYHEDSYQRSSSYELPEDDIARMRAGRHIRVPGLTPHDDTYQDMQSIYTLSPQSSMTLGEAGSDVGADYFAGSHAHHQFKDVASRLDAQGQNPSWPYRQPAQSKMFPPASIDVCSYPMEIGIPSGPPAQDRDHRERAYYPTANGPKAVTLNSSRPSRPRIPQPLGLHLTQGNNAPTGSRFQRPNQRVPAQYGPSTAAGDNDNHLPYNHAARWRRPRNLDEEQP